MIWKKKNKVIEDGFNFEEEFNDADAMDAEEKKKGYFDGKPWQKRILIFILLVALPAYAGVSVVNRKVKKEKEVVEQSKQEAFSDIHTQIEWYLLNGTDEEKVIAVSKLVGHTMDSGCSTSYEILAKYFDNDSMIYLQDFLRGEPCFEYIPAKAVQLESTVTSTDYLIIAGSRADKYQLTVYHNNGEILSFKVREYMERNAISKTKK